MSKVISHPPRPVCECDHEEFFDMPCGDYTCQKCGVELQVRCEGNDGRCLRCAGQGWSKSPSEIKAALASGKPVLMRQIGGITWLRINSKADTSKCVNCDIFEYWIGEDHPTLPASIDPEYPAHMRAKLNEVLNAVRAGRAERFAPWPRQ